MTMAKQARCEQCGKVEPLSTFDGLPVDWITLAERVRGSLGTVGNGPPVDVCCLACLVAWSHDEAGRRLGANLEPAHKQLTQTTGE
jgi:hypothetical protein